MKTVDYFNLGNIENSLLNLPESGIPLKSDIHKVKLHYLSIKGERRAHHCLSQLVTMPDH